MKNYNQKDRSGYRRDSGRRDFHNRGERREMFKAVCSECGKECEIPFEPRDGRPVYCSECFEKKEGGSRAPRDFHDRDSRERRPQRRPDFERKESFEIIVNPQLEEISKKLDMILDTLITLSLKKEVEDIVVKGKKESRAEKKISKPAKKKKVVSKSS